MYMIDKRLCISRTNIHSIYDMLKCEMRFFVDRCRLIKVLYESGKLIVSTTICQLQ